MDKGIVIFVEGYTDREFYNKMCDALRSMCDNKKFNVSKVEIRNLKGIGNYKKTAYRIFKNDIKRNNPEIGFIVLLCYDTDVFEFSPKPPVNWKDVDKLLLDNGAEKVIHVKQRKSIEDWFLKDFVGLCKYLKIPPSTKYSGSDGVKIIKNLFIKANKVYIKGATTAGFIDKLNIMKIMSQICKEIKPLCKELGVECNGGSCESGNRKPTK